jgi:hypothetical protein
VKKTLIISALFLVGLNMFGQEEKFSEYLTMPRLDTNYWSLDSDSIFTFRPNKTAECTFCFSSTKDSVFTKSCFNSVSGHVKLDTNLEGLTVPKLFGKWKPIEGGVFEILDSIHIESGIIDRTKIIHDYKNDIWGKMIFSDKTIIIEARENGKNKKKKRKYKLIDSRHLYLKKPLSSHGNSASISLIENGMLIMDSSAYSITQKFEYYFVFRTTVTRTILQKIK